MGDNFIGFYPPSSRNGHTGSKSSFCVVTDTYNVPVLLIDDIKCHNLNRPHNGEIDTTNARHITPFMICTTQYTVTCPVFVVKSILYSNRT